MSPPIETPSPRVAVHLGFACNNRCIFCAQGDLRLHTAPPTAAAVEAELRRAVAAGADVALAGGEPTLRPDLPELVATARALGVRSVLVQTNGRRLAYRQYTDALVAAGVDAIEVSWQGARPEVHDYHTAVTGSWQQTTAGLRAAVAFGVSARVSSVLTRSSFRHVAELVAGASDLGVAALHLAFPVVCGQAATSAASVVPRLALLAPQLDAAAAAARRRALPLFVSGVPSCVWEGEAVVLDAVAHRGAPARQTARCRVCRARATCAGVDPTYLARYGDEELDPRRAGAGVAADLAAHGFAGLGRVGVTE